MTRNGFESELRSAEHGFTLVEMLIALAIFGMLTAAGVALLSVSARTQETSDRLLAETGEVRRLQALLTADMAQAVPRIHRDGDGRPQRAFTGAGGDQEMLMAFVRRGWSAGDEGAALQRVGYRLRGGVLERLAFERVDGGGGATIVPLLVEVRTVRLRYRENRGEWRDAWDPADGTRLPAAIELVTDSERHGLLRQAFIVGAGR
jgi:general secretion pathway protein J